MKNLRTFDQFVNENVNEAYVPTWKQLGYEDWNSYSVAAGEAIAKERDEVFEYIEKQIGRGQIPITKLKKDESNLITNGIIEFSIEVPGAPVLNWMITIETEFPGETKAKAYIGINSPDHRGVYEKRMTGRNADAKGIWKTILDIWNGKYARKYR